MYLLYQKTSVSSTIFAIKSEIISLFIAKLLICYNFCGIIKLLSRITCKIFMEIVAHGFEKVLFRERIRTRILL